MGPRLVTVLVVTALSAGCARVAEVPAPAPAPATPPATTSTLEPELEVAALPSPLGNDVFTVAPVAGDTRVAAVDSATGAFVSEQTVAGSFAIPVVTVSGRLGGISHDGSTLVLAGETPGAGGVTRFAVLDTELAGPPRVLELDGDFSFDALSPGAERLFLIEHLPPAGSAHYRVRMLHLTTGELDPAIVVDKRFPDERMQGYPLAREESDDGLWVYTLYRDGTRNFVHALMTDGAAFCIDLPPAASPAGPWRITVERDGKRLAITNLADGAGSAIDLESLSVAAA